MASGFPGSIDSFTNPLTTSALNSPSHAGQHQDLNDAVEKIETYMGLVKVIPTSVAGTGVSLSATGTVTFTSATAVSLNGCFSALYQNYRITILITSSSQVLLTYRLRAGGTDNSGANYGNQALVADSTTVSSARTTSQTSGNLGQMVLSDVSFFTADVFGPFDTAKTGVIADSGSFVGEAYYRKEIATMKAASSFDGISFIPASGSITGTIRVYGYRN